MPPFYNSVSRPTQFGFRAKRSTNHPVHIMRRILEIYERQQNSLHVLFLDWSKAFDSVSSSAIESSLRFFGVPRFLLILSSPSIALLSSVFETQVQSRVFTPKLVVSDKAVPYLPTFLILFFPISFMM